MNKILLILNISLNISMMTILSASSPKTSCKEYKIRLNRCLKDLIRYQKIDDNNWREPTES